MTIYSLAPNAHAAVTGVAWAATGGSSPSVVADLSDLTYLSATPGTNTQQLGFSTFTLPATEQVVAVSALLRASASVAGCSLSVRTVANGGAGLSSAATTLPLSTTFSNLYLPLLTRTPSGDAWTATDVSDLDVRFQASPAGGTAPTVSLSLAVLQAYTASIPLVTPSVSVTDSARPTVSWVHDDRRVATISTRARASNVVTITTSAAHGFTVGQGVTVSSSDATFNGLFTIASVPTSTTFTYAQTAGNVGSTATTGQAWIGDSKPQTGYRVRVFTAAQYGAGGFDPATSTAAWDSGVVSGAAASVQVGADLAAGAHRAYVQTTSTSYGVAVPSAWTFAAFTVTLSPPPTPTISASWDTAAQAVTLTIAGTGTGAGVTWRFLIERSDDAGATWSQVRGPNGSDQSLTFGIADADQALTLTDYEVPRGITARYRVLEYGITSDGKIVPSSVSTTATVTTTSDTTWWVKAVTRPTLNRGNIPLIENPAFTTDEQAAKFTPLGRTRPVVVAGAIYGEDGDATVATRSAAEHAAVLALVRYQGTVLIQSPFTDENGRGLQWYARITGRGHTLQGTPSTPRRPIALAWSEVAAPALGVIEGTTTSTSSTAGAGGTAVKPHASSHGPTGDDPVSIARAQVVDLEVATTMGVW